MTSFFRRRVAQKILSAVQDITSTPINYTDQLSTSIKVSRGKTPHPQLKIPLASLIKNIPSNAKGVDSTDVLKAMRNQGLPTSEGILDISFDDSQQLLLFTIDRHVFSRIVLQDLCVNLHQLPKTSCLLQHIPSRKLVVEFSSPVLGKTFNMDHARIHMHSCFITRICQFIGHNVTLQSHVEDCGPNRGLLVAGYQNFGINEELERNAINHLLEVIKAASVKFKQDDVFKNEVLKCSEELEKGNSNLISLWTKLQTMWKAEFQETRQVFGIESTEMKYDSMLQEKIIEIKDQLLQKHSMLLNRNAFVNTSSSEISTKSDDLFDFHLYSLARSIAIIINSKEDLSFDDIYFISEESKSEYLNAVTTILENMGFDWCRNVHHIGLRKIAYFDRKKGQVPLALAVLSRTAIDVLKQLKMDISINFQNIDETAYQLAISSFLSSNMIHRRNEEYTLDWDQLLSFSADSAIGCQLCHSALVRMLERPDIKYSFDIDLTPLVEPQAHHLIQHLARFDEIIWKAYTFFEPCFLIQYINSLCYFARTATDVLNLDVKEDRLRVVKARLMLFQATQKVLHLSLKLLGITPLEKM